MNEDNVYVKDIRRIGFLVMYIFGQANRFLDSLSVKRLIEITNCQIKPFGEIINLNELLTELLVKKNPSWNKIILLAEALKFVNRKWITLGKKEIYQPSCSLKDTLLYFKYTMPKFRSTDMFDDRVTGLNGIGGILIFCSKNINQHIKLLQMCFDVLKGRITNKNGSQMFWRMDNSRFEHVINPYVLNGVAGALMGIGSLPVKYWPAETIKVAHSVAIPYAKNPDYFYGLLGIADAVLMIGYKSGDSELFNMGLNMLRATQSYRINKNNKIVWPVIDQSANCFGKSILEDNEKFRFVFDKWKINPGDFY